jgi:hypothetical protein
MCGVKLPRRLERRNSGVRLTGGPYKTSSSEVVGNLLQRCGCSVALDGQEARQLVCRTVTA